MEQDPPGGVVQAQAEVPAEEEGALARWEVTVPEPDPAAAVFALIAAPRYPTRQEYPATT